MLLGRRGSKEWLDGADSECGGASVDMGGDACMPGAPTLGGVDMELGVTLKGELEVECEAG